MSQTDEIHESFYDLFNQRFRSIEDPKHGTRFYANIAIGAHSKPCRVDPKFQCVVVVRESDIDKTPAPFLNRFEKYRLTHKELLRTVQQSLPPCLHILLNMVSVMVSIFCCGVCLYIYTMLILNLLTLNILFTSFGPKVEDFATNVTQREGNFYGFTKETVDSLLLTLLPPAGHKYKRIPLKQDSIDEDMDIEVLLLKYLLDALRENAGFQIPKVCTGWPSFLDLNCSRISTLHSPQPTPHYIHTDCTFTSHFKPDYTFNFYFLL